MQQNCSMINSSSKDYSSHYESASHIISTSHYSSSARSRTLPMHADFADDGRLYCWNWGQCGSMHACSPQLLEGRNLDKMTVVDVACGESHLACITGVCPVLKLLNRGLTTKSTLLRVQINLEIPALGMSTRGFR